MGNERDKEERMARYPVAAVLLAVAIAGWGHGVLTSAQDATPPVNGECAVYRSDGDGTITFTGTGDVVTAPFTVEVGALIMTLTTTADTGTLSATIVDTTTGGSASGPFLVGAGSAQDALPIVYRSDTVVLDVDATGDGPWTITLELA